MHAHSTLPVTGSVICLPVPCPPIVLSIGPVTPVGAGVGSAVIDEAAALAMSHGMGAPDALQLLNVANAHSNTHWKQFTLPWLKIGPFTMIQVAR